MAQSSWESAFPRTSARFGDTPELLRGELYSSLSRWHTELGDIGVLRLGRSRVVLVATPELAHQVLSDVAHFDKGMSPDIQEVFGRGLAFIPGDATWQAHRKLLRPAFGKGAIDESIPEMQRVIEDYLDALEARSSGGGSFEVDFSQLSRALTLEVLCRLIFGVNAPPDVHEAMETIADGFGPFSGWSRVFGIQRPNPFRRRLRRAREAVLRIARASIWESRGGRDMPTVRAMREGSEVMTPEEAADNMLTLLFAGHDTTAHTISWTFWLLSRPENAGLRARLMEASRDTGAGVDPAEGEWVSLIDGTLRESMRLRPAVVMSSRDVRGEGAEIGGRPVPVGDALQVWINIPAVHRHAGTWEDAERMDPGRWLPDRAASLPKGAWIPFGGGPRLCLGMYMSLVEQRLVLAALLRRYVVEVRNGDSIRPRAMITSQPDPHLRAILTPRGATSST